MSVSLQFEDGFLNLKDGILKHSYAATLALFWLGGDFSSPLQGILNICNITEHSWLFTLAYV